VVGPDGTYATFLRKIDAEKFAASVKGKVLGFADAVASVAS
jgi:hypothetical protein